MSFMSKVPEVTLWFWIIKVLSTTVGETGADLLAGRLHLGLALTSAVMTGLFVAVLAIQLGARRYIPWLYWLTVVLISVVGTLLSDNLVDGMHVSLITTSLAFGIGMAGVFALWFMQEKTLSIRSINTRRREGFYWAAILLTFAMGTSLGDLIAETLHLGYADAVLLFAIIVGIVALVHFGTKLGGVTTFWLAYILTRPLGASIGDFLAKPLTHGGLGLGTIATSLIFASVIAMVVIFISVTRIDRLDGSRG
ncbi:MAG: hypothetical protein KGQ37_05080 [Hyphomicrobiales bacterium]|nr:hypothetical protein [Hyphomicrobiales bacterium]